MFGSSLTIEPDGLDRVLTFSGFPPSHISGGTWYRTLILNGITRDVIVTDNGILVTYLPLVRSYAVDEEAASLFDADLGSLTDEFRVMPDRPLDARAHELSVWFYRAPVSVPTPAALLLFMLGITGIRLIRR